MRMRYVHAHEQKDRKKLYMCPNSTALIGTPDNLYYRPLSLLSLSLYLFSCIHLSNTNCGFKHDFLITDALQRLFPARGAGAETVHESGTEQIEN